MTDHTSGSAPRLVAGAVAAALWMLVNGLNVALTFNSTLPTALANLLLPASVRSVTWVSDPPFNVITPIVSALAVGVLVAIGCWLADASAPQTGSKRLIAVVPVVITWFTTIVAAGLVGFALALGQTAHDWPPGRLFNAFDGFPDAVGAAVLWGVVWGWLPALAFSWVASAVRRARASTRRRSVRRSLLEGVSAAVVLVAVVGASSLTGYTVPTDPDGPAESAPTAQPTGPAVPAIADNAPAVDPQWCSADQLTLAAGPSDGAAGHRALALSATNHTGVDCVLDGYPDVAFADANDFLLTLHLVRGSSFVATDPGPTTVTLSAGQSAIARLGWDAQPRDPDHTVAYVHFAPYPGAERSALPINGDLIEGADVAVTAWAAFTPSPPD